MDLSKIDKNLIVKSYIGKSDVRFFDVSEHPFRVYGLEKRTDRYSRLPDGVGERLNSRAKIFGKGSAGGRVRFVTDSSYVAVRARIDGIYRISMMTFTLSAGFDLYEGEKYLGTVNPPYELSDGGVYEGVINLGERRKRALTLNMPLYSSVMDLEIGIDGGAVLERCGDYKYEAPVLFYGSSLTHGACASRPGLSYPSLLSRRLDTNYISYGFGGGCRGEEALARHIGELSISALVCGYDHNAPSPRLLSATHSAFFRTVRECSPTLPIILMSKPTSDTCEDTLLRRSIIHETFSSAVSAGDGNVYFISGGELLPDATGDMTVDGIHPTDLGFSYIADGIEPILRRILENDNYKR